MRGYRHKRVRRDHDSVVNAAVTMPRRDVLAKDSGFSAASPRAPQRHNFHREAPFAKERVKQKRERATNGDPQVAKHTTRSTFYDRLAGNRASRGV